LLASLKHLQPYSEGTPPFFPCHQQEASALKLGVSPTCCSTDKPCKAKKTIQFANFKQICIILCNGANALTHFLHSLKGQKVLLTDLSLLEHFVAKSMPHREAAHIILVMVLLSSPASCICSTISQPPMSSPLTYSWGKVGQLL